MKNNIKDLLIPVLAVLIALLIGADNLAKLEAIKKDIVEGKITF